VAISGLLSGILVVAVNSWMQAPVGYEVDSAGRLTNIDPLATFRSPSWLHMSIHSSLACYIAVGFATAAIYAWGMFKGYRDAYHRSGLTIAMTLATISALLQPISGDLSDRMVAQQQPAKLAAMESVFKTQAAAPLLIGGIPDEESGVVRLGFEIPYGLSLLAAHDPNAVIVGLDQFPRSEWPNLLLTHVAFQVMVGCGFLLIALGLWYWWQRWRKGETLGKALLLALIVGGPLGFMALEAGWIVTEIGRQPWTIYHLMRTSEAVTPTSAVTKSFWVFTILYLGLAVVLVTLLLRLARGKMPSASALDAAHSEVRHVS